MNVEGRLNARDRGFEGLSGVLRCVSSVMRCVCSRGYNIGGDVAMLMGDTSPPQREGGALFEAHRQIEGGHVLGQGTNGNVVHAGFGEGAQGVTGDIT